MSTTLGTYTLIPPKSKANYLLGGWKNCAAHFKTDTTLYREDILRHTYPYGSAGLSEDTKPLHKTSKETSSPALKKTTNEH